MQTQRNVTSVPNDVLAVAEHIRPYVLETLLIHLILSVSWS